MSDCEKSMANEIKINHLEGGQSKYETMVSRIHERIDDLANSTTDTLHALEKNQAVFIGKVDQFTNEHNKRVDKVEEKQKESWDIVTALKAHKNIQWAIIMVIIGLIGWLFKAT